MVRRSVRLTGGDEASVAALAGWFAQVRVELGIAEEFAAEVLAAAEATARRPDLPDADLRDVPFVTVDPPGSTDLDQALHLARAGDGYRVEYAIADVPAFVAPTGPGAPVDVEARRRGQTLYAPDRRVPLHPPVLSENAASLLEGLDRPAFVWSFTLDGAGAVTATGLRRAMVRSRRRLSYDEVQAAADAHPDAVRPGPGAAAAGPGDALDLVADQAVLLREIGLLRQRQEQARGGASLPLPEQQIDARDGRYAVTLRPALPAEEWNAQLSLMTGMAAAQLMLRGGVGLLRTLPSPDPGALSRFRRQAAALGVAWPHGLGYGDLLRSLRRDVPAELALMHEAGALFRGAGYTPLMPGAPAPEVTTHAAVAAPYAHVTAPLRRLVDRFGLIVCEALSAGRPVPGWVTDSLTGLPEIMRASDALAGQLERRSTDVVEAAVLVHRVGESFDAVVVDQGRTGVKVQLRDPAVLATAAGTAPLGSTARVRLAGVDVRSGRVQFAVQ